MQLALGAVMRAIALDRERAPQGTERRVGHPLREVELLDGGLAQECQVGAEVADFRPHARDARRCDLRLHEQPVEVAGCVSDARHAILSRQRPGRRDVECERLAGDEAPARARDRPAGRLHVHAVEFDARFRDRRGAANVVKAHFRAAWRHDHEPGHRGVGEDDAQPPRHERRRLGRTRRGVQHDLRIRDADVLRRDPPAEDLERLVVGFEPGDADRRARVLDRRSSRRGAARSGARTRPRRGSTRCRATRRARRCASAPPRS